MLYTVYKTVNRITGRYYFGVHKTDDINDGYLGSGLVIKRALKKYGVENFEKQIIGVFDNLRDALKKEARLVSEHRNDTLCYNIHEGGFGGFDWINAKGLNNKADNYKTATEARLHKLKTDPEFRAKAVEWSKKGAAKAKLNPKFANADLDALRIKALAVWRGKKHSEASRKKMSEAQKGAKNHFFGRRWMNHPELGNKPVKANEIDAHLAAGWVFGRVAER